MLSRQLAVGIDRPPPAGADFDLRGLEGAHIIPFALRAFAQARQQRPEPPPMIDLKAVEVELAVVRRRGLLDRHAAAIVPAIADRDLHGADPLRGAVVIDMGGEQPRAQQDARRDNRVAENAPALLGMFGEFGWQARR